MNAFFLTLDWNEIFRNTWEIVLHEFPKIFDAIKMPIWDNFLKEWVASYIVWVLVFVVLFVIGFPLTKGERRKYRKRFFTVWSLLSFTVLVLSLMKR